MNTLYVFACSYGKFGTVHGSLAHLWRDSGSFGYTLARQLKKRLVNQSFPGKCNFVIFRNILTVLPTLEPSDIVIVNWTHIDRAYLNSGLTLMPNQVAPNKKFAQDYYRYCYDDFQALANLVTFTQYIQHHCAAQLVYSLSDDLTLLRTASASFVHELVQDPKFVYIAEPLATPLAYVQQTSPPMVFSCGHPSLEGHQHIADQFYDKIQALGYI
jgi:hypothetical protein